MASPAKTSPHAAKVFVKTPEIFGYDADGNLTSDGRWTYTYDAENRPITAETAAGTLVEHKHYIMAPTGRIAVVTQSTANGSLQANTTRYFHTDGLGSITAVSDESMEVELLRARCEKAGPFAGRRSRP